MRVTGVRCMLAGMPRATGFFHPPTQAWFDGAFAGATEVQEFGWPAIARGANTLMLAPTGSGKTLAAFLWALDRLSQLADDAEPGVRVIYVSPLKALVYDVERNLRAPLVGIQHAAAQLEHPCREVQVAVRTGDTPQKVRQAMIKRPGDILVTTPESLYLMLGSRVRETLRTTQVVILDEIHALAGTKRGVHLSLTLERLAALCHRDPQRIGLSATVRPVDSVARYLGGDRPVEVIDTSAPPRLQLTINMPETEPVVPRKRPIDPEAELLIHDGGSLLGQLSRAEGEGPRSIWPGIQRRLLEEIQNHHTTIVFVNNRSAAERLTQQINEAAEAEITLAHHGSLSRRRRE